MVFLMRLVLMSCCLVLCCYLDDRFSRNVAQKKEIFYFLSEDEISDVQNGDFLHSIELYFLQARCFSCFEKSNAIALSAASCKLTAGQKA
jgi:hypothetical protein